MSYTRQQWALAFLAALGNTHPTQATVDWVVGWTVHETTTGQGATYNLLNTTQKAAGSSQFNRVGVQNFTSFGQGTKTNALVLGQQFAGYASLKQALQNNDIAALSGSAGVRQGLKTWCGGCGYGVGFQALGAAHRFDSFPGTTYGASIPPVSSGGGAGPQLALPPRTGNGGGTIQPATGGSTTATNNNNSGGSGTDPLSQILLQFFAPIKMIGDFFGTLGPWVDNPIRIVKLVVGIGLIAIGVVATVSGGMKAIGESKAGQAALGAAEDAATGGAAAVAQAAKEEEKKQKEEVRKNEQAQAKLEKRKAAVKAAKKAGTP